jgi:hypothetical protein
MLSVRALRRRARGRAGRHGGCAQRQQEEGHRGAVSACMHIAHAIMPMRKERKGRRRRAVHAHCARASLGVPLQHGVHDALRGVGGVQQADGHLAAVAPLPHAPARGVLAVRQLLRLRGAAAQGGAGRARAKQAGTHAEKGVSGRACGGRGRRRRGVAACCVGVCEAKRKKREGGHVPSSRRSRCRRCACARRGRCAGSCSPAPCASTPPVRRARTHAGATGVSAKRTNRYRRREAPSARRCGVSRVSSACAAAPQDATHADARAMQQQQPCGNTRRARAARTRNGVGARHHPPAQNAPRAARGLLCSSACWSRTGTKTCTAPSPRAARRCNTPTGWQGPGRRSGAVWMGHRRARVLSEKRASGVGSHGRLIAACCVRAVRAAAPRGGARLEGVHILDVALRVRRNERGRAARERTTHDAKRGGGACKTRTHTARRHAHVRGPRRKAGPGSGGCAPGTGICTASRSPPAPRWRPWRAG